MNEKNLRVPTSEEAREIGKKGGQASGKARRDKRTIQQILKTVLDGDVSTLQQFAPLARKLGLESDKSIKEVYTINPHPMLLGIIIFAMGTVIFGGFPRDGLI